MLTIIIFGFVLFILGVGGTIAYDKYKAFQAAQPAKLTPKPKAKPKSLQDMNEEFLQKFKASVENNTKVLKKQKSGADDLLDKVQALKKQGRESVRVNLNGRDSIVGVDDLIKKLEAMKNKL